MTNYYCLLCNDNEVNHAESFFKHLVYDLSIPLCNIKTLYNDDLINSNFLFELGWLISKLNSDDVGFIYISHDENLKNFLQISYISELYILDGCKVTDIIIDANNKVFIIQKINLM